MNEFSLIQKLSQQLYKQSNLIKGIGDDAAVFHQTTENIVTAVDTFVEGIHFTRQTMTPENIGYRALAATLSDIAAMGASPAFYLVSIVIPKTWKEKEILDIFKGMNDLALLHHIDLIGGDTVSGKELTISVTAIGFSPKGNTRYRHDAKDGDIVFVTGTLGDSQAGLYLLLNKNINIIDKEYFIKRHQQPTPRLQFATGLSEINRLSLNDISDGIANEAKEIAEASHVTIYLKEHKLPVHPSLKQFPFHLRNKWLYFGGEDFELLGTVAPKHWEKVKCISKKTNTKITKIGYVGYNNRRNGNVFLCKGDQINILEKKGYVHLDEG